MTTHVSDEQVRHWIDDGVVQNVTSHSSSSSSEETEFNFELQLSTLPIHLIKEGTWGPIRVVGRNGFDTDRTKALLRDDQQRGELLSYIGPMLAATPGFYTFLDEEGTSSPIEYAETLQIEYRIYPDEASQQALMDAVMAIGTSMRYVQNVVAVLGAAESGE
ncbi:hypothetical protein OB955_11550 [Halobacteria archaeon AArc-m2/3/4]|uniref:Uncharacterized protein n=1 Tax=Natronoglomus mannanivorans TaxID=2979990 RepID=A0ABT2QEN5_9EURY|nr:hypothetical protein [Halobacteria archaeon AArc-m2/3/4]